MGGAHTCGVTAAETVYCWGNGSASGTGSITDRVIPTAVVGGLSFVSVSAGGGHTCGLTTDRTAYCWGSNYSGELGADVPTAAAFWPPDTVSGGLTFRTLATGMYHTCGTGSSDATYCWGSNDNGQLGDGTTQLRTTPTALAGGVALSSVSAGWFHSCALSAAGAAYCWGSNASGQLGDGTATDRLTPTAVTGGHRFVEISAGQYHTCGVTGAGAAYCWGANDYGQIGDSTTTARRAPTPVAGGVVFRRIAVGDHHSCGLTTAGAAYCWGYNYSGQLGDSTTVDHLGPTPVAGGIAFQSIVAGSVHSCGVTAAGVGYCWGYNCCGALGIGLGSASDSMAWAPTRILGGLTFKSLTANNAHTCGVTTTGASYCWGSVGGGNLLGSGPMTGFPVEPTKVVGAAAFESLVTGGSHTCGLTSVGDAYCWGQWLETYPQLGRPMPPIYATSPVQVWAP